MKTASRMPVARIRLVVQAVIVLSFILVSYRFLTLNRQEEQLQVCAPSPSPSPSPKNQSKVSYEQRNCVVSLLSEARPMFIRFGEVLGYSLMKHQIEAKKIMMVIRDQDTEEVYTKFERVGWTIDVVDVIPQVGKQAKDPRFRSLYTKLRAWNMTDTCDRIVMLDLDTLVIKNFEELFNVLPDPFKFAATPDNFYGKYTFDINAGIFVCKPDRAEFESLLVARNASASMLNADWAEQGFLNYHYKLTMIRLPITYNGNTAIHKHSQAEWNRLLPDLRIIHYTTDKPTGYGVIENEPNAMWYQVEKEFDEFVAQIEKPGAKKK